MIIITQSLKHTHTQQQRECTVIPKKHSGLRKKALYINDKYIYTSYARHGSLDLISDTNLILISKRMRAVDR